MVALNQKAQMQHPFQDKSPTKFVNAKQINFNLTNIENDDKAQIHPNWHIKQTSNTGNNWNS